VKKRQKQKKVNIRKNKMELDILGKVNPCLIFRVYTLAGKSGIALHPQTIGLGAIMTGDGTTRQGLGEN